MKKIYLLLLLIAITNHAFTQFISYNPEILGGNFNYKLIFEQEFYYPTEAVNSGYEGEVSLSFIVGINGFTSDFEVLKSVTPSLDTAFINVMKHLKWIPGSQDGRQAPMRIKKTQKFKLRKYQKLVKKRGYDRPPYKYKPYNDSYVVIDYSTLQEAPKTYYNGNEVKIHQFVSEYIKIPDAAVKQGLKGVVEIEFIVEASGRINNFKEIIGLGGGCTEEAIRLMQMLEWKPGLFNNQYVRSSYRIKVNFGQTQY